MAEHSKEGSWDEMVEKRLRKGWAIAHKGKSGEVDLREEKVSLG